MAPSNNQTLPLFPYFMLIALEAGGPLRALALLVLFPILWVLEVIGLDDKALRTMIFVSVIGLQVADVKAVSKATLPRFFMAELKKEEARRPWVMVGGCCVAASRLPRIMMEPFLREYMEVDHVVGVELGMIGGYFSGLGGGGRKMEAAVFVGDGMKFNAAVRMLCGEKQTDPAEPQKQKNNPKPLIFHDGRLVVLPTPSTSLAVLLWLPLGLLLSIVRVLSGVLLPHKLGLLVSSATGFRLRATPDRAPRSPGALYACSHRTLLDPVMVSTALQRPVPAVTYSVSRLSELISPIPTVRLRRDRSGDGATMRSLLDRGDLVVCPEGTTCREPYLLRFSPLFAEVAAVVIPVAVAAEGGMFYGTSVRGYKGMDSFFFLMNPSPCYRLEFLDRIVTKDKGHGSSYEVANQVQLTIGRALGFKCTNLTRKDKYRMLAGNDGVDTRV